MTDTPAMPGSRSRTTIYAVVGGGSLLLALLSLGLWLRGEHSSQATALDPAPKGVTVVVAAAAEFRPEHRYVGSLQPWNEAKVGPQFNSAYVTAVRVRPGDPVRRGQVLASLEPERARTQSQTSRLQADAIEARLQAIQHESERIVGLMKKGIVSINDAENKLAEAKSEAAKLAAAKSQLAATDLEVQDSTLRAPFDGEVADRLLDPGAFVHPGMPIVTVVDRRTVRVTAEAPEADFDLLAPGTPVRLRLLSRDREMKGEIARRSPAADPSTRTIHFELDLPNRDRSIPVGTTAELFIAQKQGEKAVTVPTSAAAVQGAKATVWVVDGAVAHRRAVPLLGEREGRLFLDPSLAAGSRVVLDGRTQLQEGDRVVARSSS
jgi:RND family efflux transporter MFP subunit